MTGAIVIPMRDNPDIMELLGLLDKHGFEGQKKEYMSVLNYVDSITKQYTSIMEELGGFGGNHYRNGGRYDTNTRLNLAFYAHQQTAACFVQC